MISVNEWLLIIPILLIILALIYFRWDIKPRDSAFKATSKVLKGVVILLLISVIIWFAIFVFINLGVSVFILIMFYVLWVMTHFLVKHKKELLITIFGATIAAKIEAFVAGMSILISTPIGFVYLSLGSITWVGLSDSEMGRIISQDITYSLPAWLWFVIGVIFSWGITSMTKNFIKIIESSFNSTLNKTQPIKTSSKAVTRLRVKKND